MAESSGWASKMALATSSSGSPPAGVFDSSAIGLEYISHDIVEDIELIENDGLRGTRTRNVERVALGNVRVAGSITFEPTPVEIDALLPLIFGQAGSSGSYALSDAMSDFYLMIDQVGKVATYVLRCASAVLSGEPGKKIKLVMRVVGKTMIEANAGTFPGTVPVPDATARPYCLSDMGSGITINSNTYDIDKFELMIDNKIDPTYMIGRTATDLEPQDRVITLGIQTKYTSTEQALRSDARAGTPRAASLAFTNGTVSLGLTLGRILAVSKSPSIPGRQKIRLPLNYNVYGVSTTKELVAANDSTV